ncbi:MAG: transposase [Deltaproteobacteria bacterium]|nr:transposase [Deltaproteobacteria bacterium]
MPLIHIPGGLYSVVSKCNNNEFLFDSKDKFELYLRHLMECKKVQGFKIYDIVCMSNHVHELYEVPEKVTIAKILQRVKGSFAIKFNVIYKRSGHFWKNKPFYRVVEDEEHAIACINYFHENPTRAGMVLHPSLWPFSGYNFHVHGDRTGLIGKLLDPLPGYSEFSPFDEMKIDVEKVLGSKKHKFLGSSIFQESMKTKYK